MNTHDRTMLANLRAQMRLPWRVRQPTGSATKPGVQDCLGLPLLLTGATRTARTEDQQTRMVRYAAVAASVLPGLLAHCADLERQLEENSLAFPDHGKADEILGMLELAGFAEAGTDCAHAWQADPDVAGVSYCPLCGISRRLQPRSVAACSSGIP